MKYTVQARDLSAATNYTAVSSPYEIVTKSETPAIRIIPNGDFETGEINGRIMSLGASYYLMKVVEEVVIMADMRDMGEIREQVGLC